MTVCLSSCVAAFSILLSKADTNAGLSRKSLLLWKPPQIPGLQKQYFQWHEGYPPIPDFPFQALAIPCRHPGQGRALTNLCTNSAYNLV